MTSYEQPVSSLPSVASERQRRRQRVQRWLIRGAFMLVLLPVLVVGGVYAYALINLSMHRTAPATAQLNRFDGRFLLTVSDADMVAAGYATNNLEQVAGIADTLTVIDLPLDPQQPSVSTHRVSNSVTSWPQVIATDPATDRVYVAETLGEADDSLQQVGNVRTDLPPGQMVTEVDVSAGAQAASVEAFAVGPHPVHIAASPDGQVLAVGMRNPTAPLLILPADALGQPTQHRSFALNLSDGTPAGEVSSVAWHPSGRFLAVVLDGLEVVFLEVNGAGPSADIREYGNRLLTGQELTVGRFTPDGQHYLVSEVRWQQDNSLYMLTNPPGELVAIRFDSTPDDGVTHAESARVQVGQSPEGWALSPDGRFIVTVNMLRTYLPDNLAFWPGGSMNSLSLVELNPASGALTVHGEYGFEGVLPEDAVFDADGDALGVVIYEHREDNPHIYGAIEFWNVVTDGAQPRLERSNLRLPVTRGPHTMALIP